MALASKEFHIIFYFKLLCQISQIIFIIALADYPQLGIFITFVYYIF